MLNLALLLIIEHERETVEKFGGILTAMSRDRSRCDGNLEEAYGSTYPAYTPDVTASVR
jgi:hypothetical protein